MKMSDLPEPNPSTYSVLNARNAHVVAGYAVAVVARGGRLIDVYLGGTNFSTDDESADTRGGVRHTIDDVLDRAFIIFAGVWASAIWVCHDEDVDYDTAMFVAWGDHSDTTEIYDSIVQQLAVSYGSHPAMWEWDWCDELQALWPAICDVAAMLLGGQPVTNEDVLAAVDRCRK
jgi:hypothetical protein